MISSTTNPAIKQLRQLQEKRGRAEQGLYLAEGVRLVEEALDSGVHPAAVLVASDLLRVTARGRALYERLLHERGLTRPLEVTAAVLRHVAETETPQGIVAALPRTPLSEPAGPPVRAGLALVLDGVSDPGNAGTILRTAAAAGVDLVVALAGCADLYAPKVVRAAMGAHVRLPLVVDVAAAGLDPWLASRGQRLLADARAPDSIYDTDLSGPTVLVVGSEAHGAMQAGTRPDIRHVAIPMPGSAESLNVAVATAVILFEAVRQRGGGRL